MVDLRLHIVQHILSTMDAGVILSVFARGTRGTVGFNIINNNILILWRALVMAVSMKNSMDIGTFFSMEIISRVSEVVSWDIFPILIKTISHDHFNSTRYLGIMRPTLSSIFNWKRRPYSSSVSFRSF